MATTVTLKPNAIDISGSTSGTTTLQATAVAGTTTLTLPAATDTLVGKATTDTLTNKTLTSPVLTTPALGTPASGVVTNLTGTASININGTVGATTPAAGAFTTVSATGVTTVQAGTAALPAITTSGDTDTGIFFPAANQVALATNGTQAMLVDASQNVTISSDQISSATSHVASQHAMVLRSATTNQRSIVAVAPNGSGGLADFCISATSDLQTNYNQIRIGSDGTGFFVNSEKGGTETIKSLRFGVGGTALTIDTSNNVGIGTSSPNAKLEIKAASASQRQLQLTHFNSTDGWYFTADDTGGVLKTSRAGSSGLNGEAMRIDSSGNVLINTTSTNSNEKVRIKNGDDSRAIAFQSGSAAECGYIYINAGGTGVTYSTSSDYRLKENIVPMTGALAKVAQLKPVTYTWKINGSHGQGFIAHELAEVVPDCVTGDKDAVTTYIDEDGNEATRPAYQGIDTSFLVATLTAAIQEQQALITSLTSRIAALEAK